MKQKFFLAAGLVMAFLLFITIPRAQQKSGGSNNPKSNIPDVITINAVAGGETAIEYVEGGSFYKVRLNGSKIVGLVIDGKEIWEADYVKHEPLINRILQQMESDHSKAMLQQSATEKTGQKSDKLLIEVNEIKGDAAVPDLTQMETDRARAEAERHQAESKRKHEGKDSEVQ